MRPARHPPLRLAILDDYPLVVAGLAHLLAPYDDRVRLVAATSWTTLDASVDLVLVDTLARTGSEPVDLRTLCAQQAVIVYTWHLTPSALSQARGAGAVAIFSKGLGAAELVRGLEAARDRPVFTALHEQVHGPTGGPTAAVPLSPREIEVLALVADGLSNLEIAATLYVSINSVKTHIRAAYRKIGVERRSQAVGWALDHGLRYENTRPPGARTEQGRRGR